jgi:hypothetical protein
MEVVSLRTRGAKRKTYKCTGKNVQRAPLSQRMGKYPPGGLEEHHPGSEIDDKRDR